MTDNETIAVYDEQVQTYADLVTQDEIDPVLIAFIETIPKNGFVLDLGCGVANSSAHMRKYGLRVDPVDASQEMVKLANETYSINARKAGFDDIDTIKTYDGIWANFSLLHAPQEDLPRHLTAIYSALVPDGIFHIGMKIGNGMKRDKIGRMYSYYSQEELTEHLTTAGFSILDQTEGEALGLAGDIEPWITILSKR